MTFGGRLRTEREKLGFSQGTISKFEYNIKEPSRNTLIAFEKFFDVSTD